MAVPPNSNLSAAEVRSVSEDEAGIRFDRWFRRHYPDLPHGRLEQLLRKGEIRLDGARAKSNTRLEAGQEIRIPPLGARPNERTKKTPTPVSEDDKAMIVASVLHRDDDIIVINKPAGLAVQGGTNIRRNLDAMLDALKFDAEERPRLVHRLDKETSGCLVLARSVKAASFLADGFSQRTTHKIYWALVLGSPQPASGIIDQPLSKSGGAGNEKMVGDEGGATAITRYRTLESSSRKISWLELEPETGRTHQLRAHCALIGTPVIGDGKYGGADAVAAIASLERHLYLHARVIELQHPDGGTVRVTAPLPQYFREAISFFGYESKD